MNTTPTPNDLAEYLAPEVRQAAEHAKSDILAGNGPVNRVLIKTGWAFAMKVGIPAALRIGIEFAIVRYQRDLEPIVGVYLNAMADAIGEETGPDAPRALQVVKTIIDVLRTPEGQLSPEVRMTIGNPSSSTGLPRMSSSPDR